MEIEFLTPMEHEYGGIGVIEDNKQAVLDAEPLVGRLDNGEGLPLPEVRRPLLLQHSAFFLGSMFASIASVMDLRDAIVEEWGDSESEDSESEDSNDGQNPLLVWNTYKTLSVISTLLYLLDSRIQANRDTSLHENNYAFPALFGLAASFDLISCLVDDEYKPWPSFYAGAIAVHLFLLSAVATVYINGRDGEYTYSTTDFPALLLTTGDLLFFFGSFIDVCISYWDKPVDNAFNEDSWVFVAAWSLVSSLLWFVDSILYGLADYLWELEDDDESLDEDGMDHLDEVHTVASPTTATTASDSFLLEPRFLDD